MSLWIIASCFFGLVNSLPACTVLFLAGKFTMIYRPCIWGLFLGLLAFSYPVAAGLSPLVSMFNGSDLTGWEGQPGRWSCSQRHLDCGKHNRHTMHPLALPLLDRW